MPTFPIGRRGRWRTWKAVRPPLFHTVCSWMVSLIFFPIFFNKIHPCCCGTCIFWSFLAFTLFRVHCFLRLGGWVVFNDAGAFNADISKWHTGQATKMTNSTSTSVPHFLFIDAGVTDLLFDLFKNSPLCCLYIISCHQPIFRVVGTCSVFQCCCIQCQHFQVADGAGNGHGKQYVHLCSSLFVHWTVSLICFF